MIPHRYVKAPVQLPKNKETKQLKLLAKHSPTIAKGLFFLGLIVIGSVAWPLLSYELFTAPKLKAKQFLTPVSILGQNINVSENPNQKNKATDLTKPQNWFPQVQMPKKRETNITHYTLSIPKFNIKDAVVQIGGEDLSRSLIHYPGSALPGEIGATVVFGHSVLPQFFNPQNYTSIFSLIPEMELGEEIIIRFDGITYTYKVIDKIEVTPDNLVVLEQPFDSEYLRLITCTPPGTYLRRGVITARLVDI